jgi:hypothetical protein
MLIRPNWDGFSIFLVISICMSVGAVLVGGLLMAAGLSSLSKKLVFTKKSETIHYSYESALMSFRKKLISSAMWPTFQWTQTGLTYSHLIV